MNTFEFLSHLRRLDIRLSVDGERIRCNAPQGVMTPELRAELAERKAEILTFFQEAGQATSSTLPPIRPVPRDRDLPLSSNQRRLWLLEQLEPGSPTYSIPLPCRIQGTIDIEALSESLNEIVRRHEILRTTFPTMHGQPRQVVAAKMPLELPLVDLGGLAPQPRQAEVRTRIAEETRRPFDLTRGPLLRTQLLKLSDEEHVLLLTVHHIVFDVWSFGVFARELAALYQTFRAGKPSPLAELPIQYADFAYWQQQWLAGDVLRAQLDYWKKQLDGAPSLLPLPTDRPRAAIQTSRGAKETVTLPQPLSDSLKALSQQERCSLFITLLAAFKTLLYRYTGQTDIVVGSPIANRYRPELEGLIGFFVNSLVLRTNLAGEPTFRQVMSRVRDVALGAYGHQHLPFEKLVEELQPAREMSHSPLFQVMFVLEHLQANVIQLPGLAVTPLAVERPPAKFDMTVYMIERDNRLSGTVEYNADLFDAATVRRLLDHYRILLEGIVSDPDRKLSQLPIMTGTERQQVLVDWNQTATDYPRHATIHELFERQVQQTPSRVALQYDGQPLTYAQLNARANQLAHHLRSLGVGPEVMVGICMRRSLEMVVGILGILKAGGAYVPLDPDYPEGRLQFMLADTRAPVVVTESRLSAKLSAYSGTMVRPDIDGPDIARAEETDFNAGARADNLAYVIYTSGSTGRPKGASVVHRSVVRLVKSTNYATFGPEEVFLQFAPISFDASTFELWGSLLHGSKLVVFPPHTPSLEELGQFIQAAGVTTLWLTAALFHQMVDEHLECLNGVRQLLAGGDTLAVDRVEKVLASLGNRRLINGYGPTENTTFSCCHVMTSASRIGRSVPIGRPISNTQVYILDREMQPVPPGVPGEIHLGGDGLAREYLNQPELTDEKFVTQRLHGEPSTRLYRTGDQARWLADGTIEFLGRVDHQVKIRGFRVELGEIESSLREHPCVAEAAVVVREDDPEDKQLVAYVVAADPSPAILPELRGFLRDRLPSYMVPTTVVTLDTMPLTPSGKVDRRALPAPDGQRPSRRTYVAPRSATEQAIATIWQDLLDLEKVGMEDDFFELGGHSLLATRVVSRFRDVFGISMPMRELFEGPTVGELAERVDARRWAADSAVSANRAADVGWEEGAI